MSTIEAFPVSGEKQDEPRGNWNTDVQNSYRCHVALHGEQDGTFSGIVLNLPGAGSCGDSERETLDNVREAVAGVLQEYIACGDPIPWVSPMDYEPPEGAREKWIIVNV